MKRDTMKEAGYVFVKRLACGGSVFADVLTGAKEVWFPNKGHASYGFRWRNTDWEFARSYRPGIDDQFCPVDETDLVD